MVKPFAAKPFKVQWGNPKKDSLTCIVVSLYPGDITVNIGGQSQVIALAALGTDGPGGLIACYHGNHTFTGLDAFTQYAWDASQGVEVQAANIWTAPREFDEFSIFLTGCHGGINSGSVWPDNMGSKPYENLWYYVKRIIEGELELPPAIGFVITEDVWYIDSSQVDDSAYSGHVSTGRPATTLLTYDFALGYCDFFGLLNGGNVARKPAQQFCMDNLWLMAQWGNHDISSGVSNIAVGAFDFGSVPVMGTSGNGFHKTLDGFDGPAVEVWDALFRPLQGDYVRDVIPAARDTLTNNWMVDLGCLRYVAGDTVTRSTGQHGLNESAPPADPYYGRTFGDDQIDDILEALQTNPKRFSFLNINNGLRGGQTDDDNGQGTSSFKSWQVWNRIDFQRLCTRQGGAPKSLAEAPECNGHLGSTFIVHGDMHNGYMRYMHKPGYYDATTGWTNLDENFYAMNVGGFDHGHVGGYTFDDGTTSNYQRFDYVMTSASVSNRADTHCLLLSAFPQDGAGRIDVRVLNSDYDHWQIVTVDNEADGNWFFVRMLKSLHALRGNDFSDYPFPSLGYKTEITEQ